MCILLHDRVIHIEHNPQNVDVKCSKFRYRPIYRVWIACRLRIGSIHHPYSIDQWLEHVGIVDDTMGIFSGWAQRLFLSKVTQKVWLGTFIHSHYIISTVINWKHFKMGSCNGFPVTTRKLLRILEIFLILSHGKYPKLIANWEKLLHNTSKPNDWSFENIHNRVCESHNRVTSWNLFRHFRLFLSIERQQ